MAEPSACHMAGRVEDELMTWSPPPLSKRKSESVDSIGIYQPFPTSLLSGSVEIVPTEPVLSLVVAFV